MNTGLIPVRYATALLDFANVNKEQDRVYAETKSVIKSYFQFNELRTVLDNPVLANAEKRKIILLAAGGKVIQYGHIIFFLQQGTRQRRTDKSGPARHENFHSFILKLITVEDKLNYWVGSITLSYIHWHSGYNRLWRLFMAAFVYMNPHNQSH